MTKLLLYIIVSFTGSITLTYLVGYNSGFNSGYALADKDVRKEFERSHETCRLH